MSARWLTGAAVTVVLTASCAATPLPPPQATSGPTALSTTLPQSIASPTAKPTTSATREPRPTFDPTSLSGRIVFSHEGDIWVMNADGTDREQLTDAPEEDFDPTWSPDATQIAFRSHRDGNPEVYVMDADGSGERNMTQSPLSDYSPAWSPDGTHIALATSRDPDSGGNDIYVIDVESNEPRRLTTGGGIDEYPAWSPDGARIAFACSQGNLPDGTANFEICVMDADGSDVVQITDAAGLSDYPAWSPDGSLIAFQSTRGGWPTLPGYTPLAYEEDEFGEYDVYVAAPDGSGVRNVTNNGYESDQFPGWSPDGAHLVVSRYGCTVAVVVDGSAEAQLTEPADCADVFADWSAAEAR